MAISSVKNSTALVITYKIGVNQEGKDVFVSQKFSKINNDATIEQLHTVGTAMESLLDYTLDDLRKIDDFSIVEVA
ncbi:DUF1659 domain-containing protein [Clostridium sp.]|uniref:DUF1659 domain-containing protein n=1 Tax=Clostridium sp. TaxID=1506 RepID=UPI002FC58453